MNNDAILPVGFSAKISRSKEHLSALHASIEGYIGDGARATLQSTFSAQGGHLYMLWRGHLKSL